MQVRTLASLVLAAGCSVAVPAWAEEAPTAAAPPTTTGAPPEATATTEAATVEASADAGAAKAQETAAPTEVGTANAQDAAAPAAAEPPVSGAAGEAAAQGVGEPAVVPAAPTPAAPPPPPEAVFAADGKQFDVTLGRFAAKEEAVVLLPAMQLHWVVRNKFTASGGMLRKHKSSKEIVVPLDAAVLERVLVALQDDLAARFEAAGWDARTRAELGADLPQVKGLAANADLGVATVRTNNAIYDQDWAAIALPGAQPVDPRSIGNGMAWGRFLKGKSGFNLNVTYQFAAGTVGETESRQLGTTAGSGLWFGARADIIGASTGGWGNIALKPEGLIVADEVGTLDEIDGAKSGTAENVIRFMAGMGGRDRAGFTMTPDWVKVEAAMLRAGRAFNAELVARLSKRGD